MGRYKTSKGLRCDDNSYLYTCGACNGVGYRNGGRCAYCYHKDYAKITEQLKSAKGQRYYSLLKAALSIAGKAIVDEFHAMRFLHGKVTPIMLGYLAIRFDINYKALCEWLEETNCIASGMTERIYDHPKFKVSLVYQEAEKWHQSLTRDDAIILWTPPF